MTGNMNIPEHNYYDCLVFIGRFQPFHAGHLAVIKAGLERAGMMIVICGSARQPRTIRNPWNDQERERMIRGSLTQVENNRIHVVPLPDDLYNDRSWLHKLEQTVTDLVRALAGKTVAAPRIAIIDQHNSRTGIYPLLSTRWEHVEVPGLENINGTGIRNNLFAANNSAVAQAYLLGTQATAEMPASVITTLQAFCATPAYAALKAEYDYLMQYRKSWSAAPYPPVFISVDAVVVYGQQLLLIERKNYPEQGLWALPGGFVNQDETLVDACVRELQEETRIGLTASILKNAIVASQVFDYPYRSARGRVITQAFHFDLRAIGTRPDIRGGDDARQARWTSLADLDPVMLFEDHYFIIRELTAKEAA
ncbi:MAG: hypothetical protein A3G96_05525 [Gammaproteobacteria bacterium RIFCSPLOWO2_12_FULL_52_10]|nr:MAG: hypothetical protein A3G96_05525 [Gammaproteobacteria bacterium RIFCSPLOWO2_12_FULL_52_10]